MDLCNKLPFIGLLTSHGVVELGKGSIFVSVCTKNKGLMAVTLRLRNQGTG